MKRFVLMATVALVMTAMMALSGPAFGAVHPLAHMECANGSASDVTKTQDPPGLVSHPQNIAQPIFSVAKNDTAASHAFKPEACPAQNK
jgi:hypothetical protein